MPIQGYVDRITRSEITGWAIDWDQVSTPVEISIVVNGAEVARCTADTMRERLKVALGGGATGAHEFNFRFVPPLDTINVQHVEVWAYPKREVLTNGKRTLFPDRPSKSRFTPIILTSSGRSGTTMLMQEFAHHPQIVVANAYPFEIKLTSYYAAALNVLSASTYAPGAVEIEFAAHACRDQIVGRNPWNRPSLLGELGSNHAFRLLSQTFPDRLSDLFKGTIEEYYSILATDGGIKSPCLFAEKGVLEEPVRQATRMMFGHVKEIVMVRDPRDYLCSAKNFWKQDLEQMISGMRTEFPLIMQIKKEANSDTFFVRYEDLILDPVQTRQRMYDFLGCDSSFEPRATKKDSVPDSHRTSKSPAESIGRFRSELDKETLKLCEEKFGPFMQMFDYGN